MDETPQPEELQLGDSFARILTETTQSLVCVMDRDIESMGHYQRFVQQLRHAGIRAEMYQGNKKNFGDQLKYADRRGSPLAIIQGGDERAAGLVQIKDLIEGLNRISKGDLEPPAEDS